VTYLAREVPAWRRNHPCYSCHNNGDAVRALIAAARQGHSVGAAIDETLAWLAQPEGWDRNSQGGGFDDKTLARIQFASALDAAVEAGLAPREARVRAAAVVAGDQQSDGSWRLDSSESIGSPATYGRVLATASARRTLARSGWAAASAGIASADRWLRSVKAVTVIDAAAVVVALEEARDASAVAQRTRALEILARGQAPDGGWGPYETSPSEPFDTALVMLALLPLANQPDLAGPAFTGASLADAAARGRRYLLARQSPDGSWPETTRPARQESYAQRISTTSWALLALLASGSR